MNRKPRVGDLYRCNYLSDNLKYLMILDIEGVESLDIIDKCEYACIVIWVMRDNTNTTLTECWRMRWIEFDAKENNLVLIGAVDE